MTTNSLNKIVECEVCGNKTLLSVLDLGLHPMCDDLVPVGDDRVCNEFPIEIMYCEECDTAHQHYQVPKQQLFPTSYHYRSRFTADVLNGMANLVESCEERFGLLKNKKVLDIGCNDGSLLDFFREKGAITYGVEPTGACSDAEKKGHITYNAFIDEELANDFVKENGHPDYITFTNVFAHIENLKQLVRALKKIIAPSTIIVIENHYLGSVLDGYQFDTFYHEHPRTYSFTSFEHISKSLGISLLDVEFPSRYGGNIRVYMGAGSNVLLKNAEREKIKERESQFLENFHSMKLGINKWSIETKKHIQNLIQTNGKLRAKAFPGRAAILIKMLGLNEDSISAVYEKPGSLKIGHYLPGTRIPIDSDDELFALEDKSAPILNLAWHISKEINKYMSEHGYVGPVIPILQSEFFK